MKESRAFIQVLMGPRQVLPMPDRFGWSSNGKVIGLEVKSGATQKAPGMESFKKAYEPYKVLLVGNSGIPWQEF